MQLSGLHFRIAAVVLFVTMAGPVTATNSDVPHSLDGTYDPDAVTFTLTWEYDGPTADEFIVYIDGVAVATDDPITTMSYTDDLSDWYIELKGGVNELHLEGVSREYRVAAVVGGVEGDSSVALHLQQVRPPGSSCGMIRVTGPYPVDDWLPPVSYAIYEQCIPDPLL